MVQWRFGFKVFLGSSGGCIKDVRGISTPDCIVDEHVPRKK